ncbi:MAG: VIT domain-containing protein [Propionicimonas sp.]
MTEPLLIDQTFASDPEAGLGALRTERGNLPLRAIDAQVAITGLVSRTVLTQVFANPHDLPLEATYVFPLPDRAAVTAMTLTADGRTVVAELDERGRARQEYDEAIAAGRRAAIAEQERPGVFTMRVGNILPGERVSVALTLVGPLSFEDGEATYRLPLVVAPRYIPGTPLPDGPFDRPLGHGDGSGVPASQRQVGHRNRPRVPASDRQSDGSAGDGYAVDTDAVPDASRITPPVLLPGFPNPVSLSIEVDLDPAGLPAPSVRSTLHALRTEGNRLRIEPGERVNRDFILRLGYGTAVSSLVLAPDADGGSFRLTVLPPEPDAPRRPRDVVLLLDRSGSMGGWKMVAARRAAARIIDTLTPADRFAVLAFDHRVEHPERLEAGLVAGSDRNRFAAVEFLARLDAAGGTEILQPLKRALKLLGDTSRDRSVVLVTDGQVGNEDEILAAAARRLNGARIHTVGVDQAVNAGFLGRLAALGGGRCELVESEDRLDQAMDQIHRRVAGPIVTGISLAVSGLSLLTDSLTPARVPDLYPGVPLVMDGRYVGQPTAAAVTLTGRTRTGEPWTAAVPGTIVDGAATTALWARAHVRELEDRWVCLPGWGESSDQLKNRIIDTSLRYGVLSRFTAWVAVDERVVVETGELHRVRQPVELPAGWEVAGESVMVARSLASAAPMPAPAAPVSRTGPRLLAGRATSSRDARREVSQPDTEASDGLREFARRELAGLAQVADRPAYERREYLADLGTRMLAILAGSPMARAGLELAGELTEDQLAALDEDALAALWTRLTALLDSLLTEER